MKELLEQAARAGIRFVLDGGDLRVNAPKGALTEDLLQSIRRHKAGIVEALQSQSQALKEAWALPHDESGRFVPFPLTDLQHAYWLGRDRGIEMGGGSSHVYIELACRDIDIARLDQAFNRLIERHDVLRLVVDGEGMQRILPTVPAYKITVDDQSSALQLEADRALEATRQALSHQVLRPDRWPLFDVRVTVLPEACPHLHVSLDLLLFDATSLSLFFHDWQRLYLHPDEALPALGVSFRDYVVADQAARGSEAYRQALVHWMRRVDGLPPAPELPLRNDPAARKAPRFSRREAMLDKARWGHLKAAAAGQGLTPSALLLALYAEVLARWSAGPHFTVNVTMSGRRPVHPDVDKLVGNFTTPLLHEVDRHDARQPFGDFARGVQARLLEDLENGAVSGVAVLREWSRRRGATSLQAAMPVVFSSALKSAGHASEGEAGEFGARVHSISQTSQVWLDHHVTEVDGDLVFNWDAVDAVFEDGVLDAMFAAYTDAIVRLAGDASWWARHDIVALPPAMRERRELTNRTAQPLLQRRLHAGFVAQALANPQAVAVIAAERTLTYGELLGESVAVADQLMRHGLRPDEPVAVLMRKGWEQVVAVLGVLMAGGAYMPVDAELPPVRQLSLMRLGEVRQVLAQPDTAVPAIEAEGFAVLQVKPGTTGEFGPAHQAVLDADLSGLAYVIFTSGSTGVPKGVMIDHQGAVNTIAHVNLMLGTGSRDRVLALSSLSFDLSVYDIFGLLEAGGAIVLPDARKRQDPLHWRELMAWHRVTVWNSAPQLLQMLVAAPEPAAQVESPLRAVLLSGDFIPLDLPGRVRQRHPAARVISLGGATEVSIWSIFHPIGEVAPEWSSIPYGKPLPNQTVWVVDAALRPCPDHVKGRILIGGAGLAKGYWRDESQTAARFIVDPATGARLYETGDLGRYSPDGDVIILGREDRQVKIRGHRVELGEIEAVLAQLETVGQAVVALDAGPMESRQLVAYVEPARGAAPTAAAIQTHLSQRLPAYMVPQRIVLVAAMPVSVNGKIDRQALSVPPALGATEDRESLPPRDAVESAMLEAWSRVMPGSRIGVADNFFELGGDSMLATQLVRALNEALPNFKLEMHELFETLTIESLAKLHRGRLPAEHALAPSAGRGEAATNPSCADGAVLEADIRLAVQGFAELEPLEVVQASTQPPTKAFLLTGGTGWVGAHLLAALLTRTTAMAYCLVRERDGSDGRQRLMQALRSHGIEVDPRWADRIVAVRGDLTMPRLGLDQAQWAWLAESVDSIYHLGASLNVLADYSVLRSVNVKPTAQVVQLAFAHHAKPFFFLSPMAVCRRRKDGATIVLPEASFYPDPEGLATGYAQSKWVAEQVLCAAQQRGLPVTVYRTSHALPSACHGATKPNDSYGAALQAACAAGVVPDWPDSAVQGVPVDHLADLIARDSLQAEHPQGVIHLENRDAWSVQSLLGLLLKADPNARQATKGLEPVSRDVWKRCCLEAAVQLPGATQSLARRLFADGSSGAAVDHMFSIPAAGTGRGGTQGAAPALANLTPESYWRMACQTAGWLPKARRALE